MFHKYRVKDTLTFCVDIYDINVRLVCKGTKKLGERAKTSEDNTTVAIPSGPTLTGSTELTTKPAADLRLGCIAIPGAVV